MASWQQIKDFPLPAQLVAYALIGGVSGYIWVTSNFMSASAAEIEHGKVTEAVELLTISVNKHISTYELNRVRDKIERVQRDTFALSQWIKVNPETEQDAAQREKLRVELLKLEKLENCMIARSDLCG